MAVTPSAILFFALPVLMVSLKRKRGNTKSMTTDDIPRLAYGTTAKVLHWLIVVLLLVQYPIGWLMPDIHRGQQPGMGMTLHISFGMVILLLILLRFLWRLTHPVAPESGLPGWQRLTSELVHWMLYLLVIATTLSGWLFASFRG
jgi:cytochrome b561